MVVNPAVPVEPWTCPQVCVYIIAQHLCPNAHVCRPVSELVAGDETDFTF